MNDVFKLSKCVFKLMVVVVQMCYENPKLKLNKKEDEATTGILCADLGPL